MQQTLEKRMQSLLGQCEKSFKLNLKKNLNYNRREQKSV